MVVRWYLGGYLEIAKLLLYAIFDILDKIDIIDIIGFIDIIHILDRVSGP